MQKVIYSFIMDEFLKKFGERVRTYRKLNDLSQERLAELADVSTNTINSIENGKTFLTYPTLKNICSSLNITAPQLFAFDVKPQEPDKLLSQLLIYVKKLTPAQQKQVIEIIKTFM